MTPVQPKVYIISNPEDTGEMITFLKDNNIKWRPNPDVSFLENLIEFGGRLCYESWPLEDGTFENKNLRKIREGNDIYIKNILDSGHLSVTEHGGPLTILLANVSRIETHEHVRHRLASYSQTSGRYVRCDDIKFWMPTILSSNPEAVEIIKDTINYIENNYKKLEKLYDIDNIPDFKTKKLLTSAFRRIVPNGVANNLLFTCNHRSIKHMITMRTSEAAEEEIQIIFREIAFRLKQMFPNLYQDMKFNEDGSYTFGKC